MLSIERLTVEIHGSTILADVSVKVADGEVLAVLGPSGSGKTTLLRTIAGLQRPTEGTLLWNETDVAAVSVEERGFGLMFQDYALFPHQLIGANVGFGLRMQNHPPDRIRARVAEVLDWVGMGGFEDRRITNLSGGEQQRVALARALAPSPRLLMLDEPLGSLDRTMRERLIVELRELLVEHSITAVYVTHDQEEAFTIADHLLVLRNGEVAQYGTPESVHRQPADAWTARFLGYHNIIRGQVTGGEVSAPWGRFAVSAADGEHTLVFPPDELSIDDGAAIRGRVVGRAFRGGHYLLQVAVPNGPVLEVEVTKDAPAIGSDLGLLVGSVTVL